MWAGLAWADWAAIGAYFVLITAMGLIASQHVSNLASFIMPRRFGKWMMLMHSFGTSTHSDQAVSVASKSYSSGLSGIWYQWMWLFATPFFWLIAPMMRRFRALTTADVFKSRFNQSVAMLFAVLGLGKFIVTIGTMLKGSSEVVEACTQSAISAEFAVLGMTVMFLVYGLAGGLGAAIVTDFLQGVLTIVFSFLLLPYVLSAVGGLDGMRESIAAEKGSQMLSLVTPGEIGVFYIVVIAVNSLLGVVVQPHNMGTCAAGRTEMDGAIGFMGGTFLKRICTVAWCLTGLAAIVYFQGSTVKGDQVYGQMAREFLPQIAPGLLGIFIAGLLATVMGSCDSFMIASSGLITENFYKPLRPGKSETHYLLIARISALVVVIGGVGYAYWLTDVIQGLENLWKINTVMAMAFWLGIFWRRTTSAGAWAATLATMLTWWATTLPPVIAWLNGLPMSEELHLTTIKLVEGQSVMECYLPWQMIFYLTAGLLAGIVVSLLTSPVEETRLDNFYALLRTPITPGEEIDSPCTLPKDAVVPPRRVFFPNSNFEIPIPTWRAMSGFLIGWILVGLIIGSVAWWIAA